MMAAVVKQLGFRNTEKVFSENEDSRGRVQTFDKRSSDPWGCLEEEREPLTLRKRTERLNLLSFVLNAKSLWHLQKTCSTGL